MITVSKVRDADYYLAEISADDAGAYYAGTERPGRWHGTLAELLGLVGDVDPADFRDLLAGKNPSTGTRLPETFVRVAALDVTLSVPKSVSVMWATSDLWTRHDIERSLDAAERAVIELIEAEATLVRRGHAGAELQRGRGVVVASFDHRTSRLADPNLHRHLVVANASQGEDGRITGLDTRQLYRIRYTAEAVFQSVLRHELARELGCHFDPIDRHGVGEVVGISKAVRREFSQRRQDIEAEMAVHGSTTGRGARLAALTTRPPKPDEPPECILLEDWHQRARALGFDPNRIPLDPREPTFDPSDGDLAFRLTEKEATHSRRDVIRHVARSAPDGATLDDILRHADHYLDTDYAVRLDDDRYTTPEILALETECVRIAVEGRDQYAGKTFGSSEESVIAHRPELDADQRHLLRRVTGSGNRVEVIIGPPGTGKTLCLEAVRAAYDGTHKQLTGAALAARAAIGLEEGTGIPSMTVHRLLNDIDTGRRELTGRDILVIDEAAMVGTRQLATLITATERARAKIILVGDPAQLPTIDAGGLFAAIADRIDPIVLTVNRRQQDAHERLALDALRAGGVDAAIQHWLDAGRIRVGETADAAMAELVDGWYATHTEGDVSYMAAALHEQVDALNRAGRQRLVDDGTLGQPIWRSHHADFSVGDRVLAHLNDYDKRLFNGEIGTVVGTSPEGLVIDMDERQLTVDADYIDAGRLTHAYALTVHKAQGATIDHTHFYADDGIYNELGYTGISRGRHTNHFYLPAARDEYGRVATDRLQELRAGLATSRAKRAAIDLQMADRSLEPRGIDLW